MRNGEAQGYLACGQCGGGFTEAHKRGVLECSWHRGRCAVVCPSTLRIPTAEVEARVLAAIRETVLTPENLAYAAERTLEEISRARQALDPAALRYELEAFTVQREQLIDFALAGAMEKTEATARLKASLERKRELERRLAEAEAQPAAFDPVAMRPVIEATLTEIHAALAGDPTERREALRALLGAERLRIYPHAEKGFHLEGTLRVRIEDAPHPLSSGGHRYVAGGRYVRDEPVLPDEYAPLPWAA